MEGTCLSYINVYKIKGKEKLSYSSSSKRMAQVPLVGISAHFSRDLSFS
jgi:hypothetical protein